MCLKVKRKVRGLGLAKLVRIRPALKLIASEFWRRFYSNEELIGFQFDLTREIHLPDPEFPLTIRELSESDVPGLLDPGRIEIDDAEFRYVLICRQLIEDRLPTCYVAAAPDGKACCMCWLVRACDSKNLQDCFGEGFYRMCEDEALLENIYCHWDFRGRRLMKYLSMALFKKAAESGARRAVAFISKKNSASLAGAKAIGWEPFLRGQVRWRLFRRRTFWVKLT